MDADTDLPARRGAVAGGAVRLKARTVGLLYLVIAVAAAFAEFHARDAVIVPGDAAATAARILAHEPMYRLGGAADLVVLLCDAAIAVLLYELLRPVSRTLALMAAVFRLCLVAVNGVGAATHFAPLLLLHPGGALPGFSPMQLQGLALLSLRLHSTLYSIALIFFGVQALLLGLLIYRSEFLPRIFGLLMGLAGIGYLVHSFAALVAPLPPSFAGGLLLASGLCELALMPWLLIVGIDPVRWRARGGE
jgi:uncharacterized protein DUF4386